MADSGGYDVERERRERIPEREVGRWRVERVYLKRHKVGIGLHRSGSTGNIWVGTSSTV